MLIVVEQMKIKKNGDCIFEDKLEGAVSVCVMALIRKNIINYCVTPPYFYEKDVRCQVRGQNHHRSTAKACVKLDIIANFPAFAGLSTAFVVLCVLTKGGAHNGTDYDKRIYCGKANEKERRLYSREQTRRCSLRLCYRRRGEKQ